MIAFYSTNIHESVAPMQWRREDSKKNLRNFLTNSGIEPKSGSLKFYIKHVYWLLDGFYRSREPVKIFPVSGGFVINGIFLYNGYIFQRAVLFRIDVEHQRVLNIGSIESYSLKSSSENVKYLRNLSRISERLLSSCDSVKSVTVLFERMADGKTSWKQNPLPDSEVDESAKVFDVKKAEDIVDFFPKDTSYRNIQPIMAYMTNHIGGMISSGIVPKVIEGEDYFVLFGVIRDDFGSADTITQVTEIYIKTSTNRLHALSTLYGKKMPYTPKNLKYAKRQMDIAIRNAAVCRTWQEVANVLRKMDDGKTSWKKNPISGEKDQ